MRERGVWVSFTSHWPAEMLLSVAMKLGMTLFVWDPKVSVENLGKCRIDPYQPIFPSGSPESRLQVYMPKMYQAAGNASVPLTMIASTPAFKVAPAAAAGKACGAAQKLRHHHCEGLFLTHFEVRNFR